MPATGTAEDYNGWKNRATWNVALWLNNDGGLYNLMLEYARKPRKPGQRRTYRGFVRYAGLKMERTPDGFKYAGSRLDYSALSDMIRELAQ